jgi:hypothetical protein
MNARKLESGPVREAVRGRWVPVLQALAPELEAALAKPGRHVPCPVHGGRDGFRLFKDVATSGGGICNTCGAFPDGFSLLQWLKGWRFPQALEAVDAVFGGVALIGAALSKPALSAKAQPRKSTSEDAQIRRRLAETWAQSKQWQDALSQPLRDYLVHRGLDIGVLQGVEAIRFHPGLRYHDEDGHYGGTFPVMLAQVADIQGKPVTLHRTYLTQAGRKAPVENPKRMMPVPSDQPVLGGAIRMGTAGPVIDLAEGIETALAVRQATGLPVWSAVSAALLAGFDPPPRTEKVRIWCDRDRKGVGEEAAHKLAERLAEKGISSELLIPPEAMLRDGKGVDWLDVLNDYGPAAFPLSPNRRAAA